MNNNARQLGNHWTRMNNRLLYVGSWEGASAIETGFRNSASAQGQASLFIEHLHFPWSRLPLTPTATEPVVGRRARPSAESPPPRSTLIRVTVCDHPQPHTLLQHFRELNLTDIFLTRNCRELGPLAEFHIHQPTTPPSIAEVEVALQAQLRLGDGGGAPKAPAPVYRASASPVSATGKGLYVFTAAAFNYLPKARLLVRSLRDHIPDAHLCLALSDVPPPGFDVRKYGFDSMISAGDLSAEIPELESWIFRHDVMELSTAIKPFVLNRLLAKSDCKAVLFLDPDCYMFNSPSRLLEEFGDHSILITPHQAKAEDDDRMMFREVNHLRFGIYNLGFLGVKNDDEGRRFATWWQKRLGRFCLIDLQGGLFTDQRWIDHVPVFFERVKILRDSAYNVACWNFRDRLIQGSPASNVTADGMPICFFHFAGTTGGYQKYMGWWGRDKSTLQQLLDWYLASTKALDDEPLFTRQSPYDSYSDGTLIHFLHRLVYREEKGLEERFRKPYSEVGPGSFQQFVSDMSLPNYTRSDLLFGPEGRLLHHVKKSSQWTDSLRAIREEAEQIDRIQSDLLKSLP